MSDLPEYGDTVYFAPEAAELITIEWQEKFEKKVADYYKAPAYIVKATVDQQLEYKYETLLFIARERFQMSEWDMPKALAWDGHGPGADHIMAKFKEVDKSMQKRFGRVDWLRGEIDDTFFYGQNKAKTFRWLVYHPEDRKPAQGRFIKSSDQQIFEGILKLGQKIASIKVDINDEMVEQVESWSVACFGHQLHRFRKGQNQESQKGEVITIDYLRKVAKIVLESEEPKMKEAMPLFGAVFLATPAGKN